MHLLAIIALAVPLLVFLLFVVWLFSDGFTDWRSFFEIVGMVLLVAALALGAVWGCAYLEWESKAKSKPQTAEAPLK